MGHWVIPRSKWRARPPRERHRLRSTSDGVFIHHTVGNTPRTKWGERREMRAIQDFHMEVNGWDDIAYSFVVFPSGRIYEARGKGVEGAHTEGFNRTSHAICAAGDYTTSRPTGDMVRAMRWLRRNYLNAGADRLRPHSAVASTSCPGRHLRARLADL